MSFTEFVLQNEYEKLQRLGDRLTEIDKAIDWELFRPIIAQIFRDGPQGGRPHTDEILIAKSLVLQGMYSLSDEQLEFQCIDRISFRKFLNIPDTVPNFSTIWKIKEKLSGHGSDNIIWAEFQRQLVYRGFEVKKGVVQDATIQPAKRPTGESPRDGRDRDGGYTVKAGKTSYGYKLHTKVCLDYGLIRELATTPANTHDSKINLVRAGDKEAYRDKGYAGTPICEGVVDCTMKKAYRNTPLTTEDKQENLRLSKIRSPGERPYHVIKNCFGNTLLSVTTSCRVHIRNVFTVIAYNLFQIVTLSRLGIARAIPK
jgi:transposase, IS5 family